MWPESSDALFAECAQLPDKRVRHIEAWLDTETDKDRHRAYTSPSTVMRESDSINTQCSHCQATQSVYLHFHTLP